MNPLIKELIEQATITYEHATGAPYSVFDEELFAQMIVRKCAQIAVDTDLSDVEGGDSAVLRAAAAQIQEGFGL